MKNIWFFRATSTASNSDPAYCCWFSSVLHGRNGRVPGRLRIVIRLATMLSVYFIFSTTSFRPSPTSTIIIFSHDLTDDFWWVVCVLLMHFEGCELNTKRWSCILQLRVCAQCIRPRWCLFDNILEFDAANINLSHASSGFCVAADALSTRLATVTETVRSARWNALKNKLCCNRKTAS